MKTLIPTQQKAIKGCNYQRKKNNNEAIETNTTEGKKGMQLPAEKNHEEDAFKAKFDDPGVLQPDSNNSEDVSNAKSDNFGVLHPGLINFFLMIKVLPTYRTSEK